MSMYPYALLSRRYSFTHTTICVCMHVCIHTYHHMCMYVCTYICVCVCVYIYIYIYNIYMCIYMYIIYNVYVIYIYIIFTYTRHKVSELQRVAIFLHVITLAHTYMYICHIHMCIHVHLCMISIYTRHKAVMKSANPQKMAIFLHMEHRHITLAHIFVTCI